MVHIDAETDFGLALLRQTKDDESVVLSPISISLALALVHAGANGATKKQIKDALLGEASDEELIAHYHQLGTNVLKSERVQVLLANRFYVRTGFTVKQSYIDTIAKEYEAKAEILDFDNGQESAKTVNEFIEEVTRKKITNMVNASTFKPSAVALIINAIYFDGIWQHKFNSNYTHEADFYVSENITRKVQYLSAGEVHRLYAETDDAQILTLNYEDEAYAFTIILPKERFGLAKLRANLTGAKLQEMLASVKNTYVTIKFPKFKIEKELGLNEILQTIGITDVFGGHADLSGIAPNLYVSEAKHKAVIEVVEGGTKAAAATAVTFERCYPPPVPKVNVVVDHPFIFALSHESHLLFAGRSF